MTGMKKKTSKDLCLRVKIKPRILLDKNMHIFSYGQGM